MQQFYRDSGKRERRRIRENETVERENATLLNSAKVLMMGVRMRYGGVQKRQILPTVRQAKQKICRYPVTWKSGSGRGNFGEGPQPLSKSRAANSVTELPTASLDAEDTRRAEHDKKTIIETMLSDACKKGRVFSESGAGILDEARDHPRYLADSVHKILETLNPNGYCPRVLETFYSKYLHCTEANQSRWDTLPPLSSSPLVELMDLCVHWLLSETGLAGVSWFPGRESPLSIPELLELHSAVLLSRGGEGAQRDAHARSQNHKCISTKVSTSMGFKAQCETLSFGGDGSGTQTHRSLLVSQEMVSTGVVFICRGTGKTHHCDPDTCFGEILDNSGVRICPISGFVKGSVLQNAFERKTWAVNMGDSSLSSASDAPGGSDHDDPDEEEEDGELREPTAADEEDGDDQIPEEFHGSVRVVGMDGVEPEAACLLSGTVRVLASQHQHRRADEGEASIKNLPSHHSRLLFRMDMENLLGCEDSPRPHFQPRPPSKKTEKRRATASIGSASQSKLSPGALEGKVKSVALPEGEDLFWHLVRLCTSVVQEHTLTAHEKIREMYARELEASVSAIQERDASEFCFGAWSMSSDIKNKHGFDVRECVLSIPEFWRDHRGIESTAFFHLYTRSMQNLAAYYLTLSVLKTFLDTGVDKAGSKRGCTELFHFLIPYQEKSSRFPRSAGFEMLKPLHFRNYPMHTKLWSTDKNLPDRKSLFRKFSSSKSSNLTASKLLMACIK